MTPRRSPAPIDARSRSADEAASPAARSRPPPAGQRVRAARLFAGPGRAHGAVLTRSHSTRWIVFELELGRRAPLLARARAALPCSARRKISGSSAAPAARQVTTASRATSGGGANPARSRASGRRSAWRPRTAPRARSRRSRTSRGAGAGAPAVHRRRTPARARARPADRWRRSAARGAARRGAATVTRTPRSRPAPERRGPSAGLRAHPAARTRRPANTQRERHQDYWPEPDRSTDVRCIAEPAGDHRRGRPPMLGNGMLHSPHIAWSRGRAPSPPGRAAARRATRRRDRPTPARPSAAASAGPMLDGIQLGRDLVEVVHRRVVIDLHPGALEKRRCTGRRGNRARPTVWRVNRPAARSANRRRRPWPAPPPEPGGPSPGSSSRPG